MTAKRATQLAHEAVAEVLRAGERAVDATAGNGHDTLFLAQLVGEGGRVLAFDVQRAAIESAKARIGSAGLVDRVEFFQESHAGISRRVEPGVGAVMFNLGYLPGGDHGVITEAGETLKALDGASGVLRPGGVLTVVCYPGHEGGGEESRAVVAWAEIIGAGVMPAARPGAPFLVVWKKPGPCTGRGDA